MFFTPGTLKKIFKKNTYRSILFPTQAFSAKYRVLQQDAGFCNKYFTNISAKGEGGHKVPFTNPPPPRRHRFWWKSKRYQFRINLKSGILTLIYAFLIGDRVVVWVCFQLIGQKAGSFLKNNLKYRLYFNQKTVPFILQEEMLRKFKIKFVKTAIISRNFGNLIIS